MREVEVHRALADESRVRVVRLLSRGFFSVQEIVRMTGLSQPTVSHHLRVLGGPELVESRRDGARTFYRLSRAPGYGGRVARELVGELVTSPAAAEGTAGRVFAEDDAAAEEVLRARAEEGRRFFDRAAPSWRGVRREAVGDGTYLEVVSRLVPRGGVVAELGCGSGTLLERILPREGATYAIDYSQGMLDAARAELGRRADDVTFVKADLTALPLPDASIDVAVACMVLHHLTDPAAPLAEVARVLKPGGTFVIAELRRHSHEYMRERYADVWLGFDPAELSEWCAAAGLSAAHPVSSGDGGAAFCLVCRRAPPVGETEALVISDSTISEAGRLIGPPDQERTHEE